MHAAQTTSGAGTVPVGIVPNRASLALRTLLQFYYDEIRNLRLQGGDVIVSFGGANGQELAQVGGCEVQGRQGHAQRVIPCPCHACKPCCC